MIKKDQPTIFTEGLMTAVSSKVEGNLSLSRGAAKDVLPAREQWLKTLGLELEQTVFMDVTHPETWDAVYEVTSADKGKGAKDRSTAIMTDALITDQPGIALFLFTADCQPVIIYDPINHAVALAHLGWQSVDAQLIEAVVAFMAKRYGSAPAELQVYVGPAIKATSYVQPYAKQADDPHWRPYIRQVPTGVQIDISAYLQAQVLAAGIRVSNIQVCPVDTATSSDYFSHYRAVRSEGQEPEGRFATVCMLYKH